jgi:hypothetical protein
MVRTFAVLARLAVSARARQNEVTPFVHDLDARPVELRFDAEHRRRARGEAVVHASHELLHLVFAVSVVERKHPDRMLHLRGSRTRLARHALRGRLRGNELRMGRLERS